MTDTPRKITDALELYLEGQEQFRKAENILKRGPHSFYERKMIAYIETLFDRFAPFKEGDRVKIVKAPKCDGGWSCYKDLMVKGAKGVVTDVDLDSETKVFTAYVKWDNESYTDMNGKKRKIPEKDRHVFLMNENQIKKI